MCLIIFAPKINRARIQKAVLEKAFHRNNDGAGLAWIEDGKIRISKVYEDFPEFFLDYQKVRARIHVGSLLIHFRRGTGGSNNHTNTQPLVIYRGRLVMAHNGVFNGLEEQCEGEDISDSVLLARRIREMGWNFPFLKSQTDLLDLLCRNSSKLVFMDNKGRHIIINEKAGKWWHGAWYSNEAFVDVPKRKKNDYWNSTHAEDYDERRYSMYPRYPGDTDYIRPTKTEVFGPAYPKTIPPGTRYADMTTAQKQEFESYKNRMRENGSLPQFRKHSVINPPIPEKEFGLHTDPDSLSDEDWKLWHDWNRIRQIEFQNTKK